MQHVECFLYLKMSVLTNILKLNLYMVNQIKFFERVLLHSSALFSLQKFSFMTSDYLNPDLINEAEKRRFSIIPKELVSFALKRDGGLDVTSTFSAEAESV